MKQSIQLRWFLAISVIGANLLVMALSGAGVYVSRQLYEQRTDNVTGIMKRFEFHLAISAQRYLNYYRGKVKEVVVRCSNGTSVQFPASFLIQFVACPQIPTFSVDLCSRTHS